jgi:hypothetical protein
MTGMEWLLLIVGAYCFGLIRGHTQGREAAMQCFRPGIMKLQQSAKELDTLTTRTAQKPLPFKRPGGAA